MHCHYFIGIDISKLDLDITVLYDGELLLYDKIRNTERDIKAWLKAVSKQHRINKANSLFCMEYTGLYESFLLKVLKERRVWIESGLQIKWTLGMQRGKNDKIDSLRIANYCFLHRHCARLWEPPRKEIQQLKALRSLRNRIIRAYRSLKVVLQDLKTFQEKSITTEVELGCARSLSSLKEDKLKVEERMHEVIKNDKRLLELFEIITSVDHVGAVLATEMLITTNEFKRFDSPKKFACYAGVAPFEYSSGSSLHGKGKVSKMANNNLKSVLHLSAVSAIVHKGELQDYYRRKVAEGHPKMSVMNAIRNKLIHRIFACVRDGRCFEKAHRDKQKLKL